MKDRIANYARKGVALSEQDAQHEVVADLTKRVLCATQDDIDRLVGGNPTVGQRILDSIKSVIDKIKGIDTSTEDRLNKVRQMFENAIAKQHGGNADGSNADGVQYSVPEGRYD